MSTIGYFSLIFWVANKIVVIPGHEEDGVSTNAKMRTFATEKDLTEGVDNLWNAVMQTLFIFLVPFFIKGVFLKNYGKYFSTKTNGIRAPKRFLVVNTLQMILLIPVTSFVMILRFAAVFSRAIYLLGDMDKPFGVFDTLDYGWRSIIELMRMRAEFREKCYHVAKEIRESNNDK